MVHDTTSARSGLGNKIALGTGAVAAAGALVFGGVALTSAWFTSQASIGDQNVTTATVEFTADIDSGSSSPIEIYGMLPGDTQQPTEVLIRNTGTEDVYFGIGKFVVTGDQILADALQLEVGLDDGVSDDGGPTHTGSLQQWEDGQYEGFLLKVGQTRVATVQPTLPTTTGDEVQDKAVEFSMEFTAVQARNWTGATTPTWVDPETDSE